MAKKRKRKYSKKSNNFNSLYTVFGSAILLVVIALTTFHLVQAGNTNDVELNPLDIDPNFGIKNQVVEFFEANNAPEMVPIIRCESQFKHYSDDGTILQNKSGSSAIGVAQIMSSVHPDPKIIKRYNKLFDMDLTINDFNVETLEGNLGYALVLYKVNGTKDWECSKRFRW